MRNILLMVVSVLLMVPATSRLALPLCGTATTQAAPAQRNAKEEGWSDLLPAGKDRDSVLDTCANCHSLKVVVHARKSRAEWAKSVDDMIQRGAPIFPEEIEPITAYLSKAFGPDVPKPVNVNTASREELEKLPNLKPEMVARILEARGKSGPFKNAEELRKALTMEQEDFEKIRFPLKYGN